LVLSAVNVLCFLVGVIVSAGHTDKPTVARLLSVWIHIDTT